MSLYSLSAQRNPSSNEQCKVLMKSISLHAVKFTCFFVTCFFCQNFSFQKIISEIQSASNSLDLNQARHFGRPDFDPYADDNRGHMQAKS